MNDDRGFELSGAEVKAIIMAVAHGQPTFTEDHVRKLIIWAKRVMLDHALVSLILKGRLSADVRDENHEQWAFKEINHKEK